MTRSASTPRIVRFGVFEIDLAKAELRKHGLRIRIQEQPYQILQALLERPGELVPRPLSPLPFRSRLGNIAEPRA